VRIYRRPGGKIWWCQYKGERFSLKTQDEKAAHLKFADIQRREADPSYRPADPTATLGRALKDFVAQQAQKGRAQGTLDMYDVHVAHLARVLGEHTLLAHVAAPELDSYVTKRYGEGAKEPTIYKELATLRGTLKLARRHRKYPHALDEVMPEIKGASEPGTAHLKRAEVNKLLAVLDEKRAAVVAFIVATGADLGSVELAEVGDFDLKAGSVLVRGTKTATRWRTIPVLKPFADLAERAAAGVPFEPWGNVRRDLAVACKAAEVPKITPRDLRRTHGSILRGLGVEPHLIGKMLGHTDSRMVERIYGQLPTEALAKLLAERVGPHGGGGRHAGKKRRSTPKAPRKAQAEAPRVAEASGKRGGTKTVQRPEQVQRKPTKSA
jgi:integrase